MCVNSISTWGVQTVRLITQTAKNSETLVPVPCSLSIIFGNSLTKEALS